MHRFFVPPDAFQDNRLIFPREISRQIQRVLRLRTGAEVVVLDGSGLEYRVRLSLVNPSRVEGLIEEREMNQTEPSVSLSLFISLTQREKFEWVLQKCTEIGVGIFMPFISSRSLVQDYNLGAEKISRWKRIIQEAAEQSGRGILPQLMPVTRFEQAVDMGAGFDGCLTAWELEQTFRLQDGLHGLARDSRLALMIGPEGGFSEEEISLATDRGWKPITLGPRVLRMETAALVASALIMDHFFSNGIQR